MSAKALKIGGDLHRTPADNRDLGLSDLFNQPAIEEVSPVDWGFWQPLEIKDQQRTQECTGHGVAAAIEAHEGVLINPSLQYALIKALTNDPTDTGADLRTAMKSGLKYGAVKKEDCSLGLDTKDGDFLADIKNYPPEVLPKSEPQKQKSFFNATRGRYSRFDNFRTWLWYFRDQKPVIVTGVGWRENWTYAEGGVVPNEPGDVVGGHCVVLLPEQRIINGEPYLKIQNSYGRSVGDNGCHWVNSTVINRDFTYGGYIYQDLDLKEARQIINDKTMAEFNPEGDTVAPEVSKKYSFNKAEQSSAWRGVAMAMAGVFLTKALEIVMQTDFGPYDEIVVGLASILVNSARLWLQGQK